MTNAMDESQNYFENRRDTNKSHTGNISKGRKSMNLSQTIKRK